MQTTRSASCAGRLSRSASDSGEHGLDTDLLAGTDDANGNLAPIGDQHPGDGHGTRRVLRGTDAKERLTVLDKLVILDQYFGHYSLNSRGHRIEHLHDLDQCDRRLSSNE